MKNFVQPGVAVTLIAPAGGVASGGGVLVGALFGIAATDAAEGAEVEVETQGVFEMAKDGSTFAQGAKVYWDNAAKAMTSTATGNKLVGAALLAADAGGTTVRVRLNGVAV